MYKCAVLFLLALTSGFGAARLRLTSSVVTVNTSTGADAGDAFLYAFTANGGTLKLTATPDAQTNWLSVEVQPIRGCVLPVGSGSDCTPLRFQFHTAKLPRGTYTGSVTISDPDAIDAPQVLTVTVQVGASGATAIDTYLNPGRQADFIVDSATCSPSTPCTASWNAHTDDGGKWMTVVVPAHGSFYGDLPVSVRLAPSTDMAPGQYKGSVVINEPVDPRTVPVTLHLVKGAIGVSSTDSIRARLVEDGLAISDPDIPPIRIRNVGYGNTVDIPVQSVSTTGLGISARVRSGAAYVKIDPASRNPGTYSGTVTLRCTAANCPLEIPVQYEIVKQGPPLAQFRGIDEAVKSQTRFPAQVSSPSLTATPGGLLTIAGEQFAINSRTDRTQVLVNGAPVHLLSLTPNHAQIQVPSSTPIGLNDVQVVRHGVASNRLTVEVAAFAPQITSVATQAGRVVDQYHPVHRGDTVWLDATGLGATTPAVNDGRPAPRRPLAVPLTLPGVQVSPFLYVGDPTIVLSPVISADLIPGQVGLFEVAWTVPSDAPAGVAYIRLVTSGMAGEFVAIAIEP